MKKRFKSRKEIKKTLKDAFFNTNYGYNSVPTNLNERIKKYVQSKNLEKQKNVFSFTKFLNLNSLKFIAPVALAASFMFGIILSPSIMNLYNQDPFLLDKQKEIIVRGEQSKKSQKKSKTLDYVTYNDVIGNVSVEKFEENIKNILPSIFKDETQSLKINKDLILKIFCKNIFVTENGLNIKILNITNNKFKSFQIIATQQKSGEYDIVYINKAW